jgi:YD repeat-containing protein
MLLKLKHKALVGLTLIAIILIPVIVSFAVNINYIYDNNNRLIRVEYGDGRSVEYVYDEVGNLLQRVTSGPKISVSPASHNFGDVTVGGSSSPLAITVSNIGTSDLHVSGMFLSDTTNYSLNTVGGASPCGSTTPTIMPGNNCTVTVTFSPSSAGTKNSDLTINSDDPDTQTLNVPLSGTGVEQGPIINKIRGVKKPGLIVRIIGTNFGDTQGNSVVHIGPKTFNSSSPRIKLWSDTKIRIRLPNYQCGWFKGQDYKYIRVWVIVDGVDSNKKRIKVLKPASCL